MLFKMNSTEAINLRKEIMALTKDIKADIIQKQVENGDALEGKDLQDRMEAIFNNRYQSAKYFVLLTRREGMELVFKQDHPGSLTSLYYQVTSEALSSLDVIFNEYNRGAIFTEKKFIKDGYLPNGVGPINRLFILTIYNNTNLYKALTQENFSYPVFLRPYKVLLEKRVRLGELLTAAGGQSYLMDKLLGKNKCHSRSRKVRKMRHSLYRKSHSLSSK